MPKAKAPSPAAPKRGEVYRVSLDPVVGSEIGKTRPALVVQNDVGNRFSRVTIVAAITSKFGPKLYPTEVPVPAGEGGLGQDSVVLLNQVRTVDRQRLVRRLGRVRPKTLRGVDKALAVSLGLVDLP